MTKRPDTNKVRYSLPAGSLGLKGFPGVIEEVNKSYQERDMSNSGKPIKEIPIVLSKRRMGSVKNIMAGANRQRHLKRSGTMVEVGPCDPEPQ